MLINTLKKWAKSLTSERLQQANIEHYVISKNPQSVADVEHWAQEYTRKQTQGWAI
jgi:hypothetical protein